MEGIVNIKVGQLYPHPDNPRKDVGDVTELAESIKKSGIMQNLTVIPITALSKEPDEQPEADEISLKSDFHVLIGHRRLAASKLAGLQEVPCKIVSKISKKEQVAVMLEENMQRADLTIWEQAQGFQMMLDLGETEDSIAEKTGFSKKTIKHRLNIAKLDQGELKKKEQDDSFQMTLKDLYELEKVEDVNVRNKILKEANSSRDLIWKAQSAVKDAERQKKTDKIIELLKAAGVEKAPKGAENEMYSNKWEVVKEYELDKEVPKQLRLPKQDEPIYYLPYWRAVRVIRKAKKEKKEATPEELKRKEIDKKKKQIKEMMQRMDARRKEFVKNIINGKIEAIKDVSEVKDELWITMMQFQVCMYPSSLERFFIDKPSWEQTPEEKDEAQKSRESLSIIHQMLVLMSQAMAGKDIYDYNGRYYSEVGAKLKKAYGILKKYGWSFEDDEEQLLDGTHELYMKKENE